MANFLGLGKPETRIVVSQSSVCSRCICRSRAAREPGQGEGIYNGVFTVATTYDSAMYASDGAAASLGDEYAVARTRKPRAPAVIGRGSGEEPQKEDAAFRFKSLTPADAAVLDRFWSLRGVLGADKRQGLLRLGDAAMEEEQGQEAEASFGAGPDLGLCGVRGAPSEALMPHLSGAVLTWEETGDLVASERIREVSRRLLALHRVLGGESVDVAMMVFREPRLLDVNPASLTQRLLEMRLVEAGPESTDILRVVEDQPALLLSEIAVDSSESAEQRHGAWKSGITTDNDPEWEANFAALASYKEAMGDAHVGFREGDSRGLARWSQAQRAAFREGRLKEERRDRLALLGFRFDEADAEWLRWFAELRRNFSERGVAAPDPLGDNIKVINWCGVQRIAMRCGRLTPEKIGLLESVGFDWAGADPLS